MKVDKRNNRKNFWEIKAIKWEWEEAAIEGGGYGIGVCEVKDDNGNPFLRFGWEDMGYSCHEEDVGIW